MTAEPSLAPIDLDRIARDLRLGTAESRRPIGLARVEIGRDALDGLAGIVASVRRAGPVVILSDRTPKQRLGHELTAIVCERLAALGPELVLLGADGSELHADPAALDRATVAVANAGCVVAVGSGTVCDLGKEATNQASGGHDPAPYVVVQTACSVNAFSDDMAVVLLHGVKRTIPSRWVDALVIDLGVIADAPPRLNQSGVGELVSMFTAPADWRLANALGMGTPYDGEVVALFRDGGPRLLSLGAGVAARDATALRDLSVLMTHSGLALGIAGQSAPISGAEHTIGHLLDMAAAAHGTTTGLHGSQVGVAAIVAAVVWRRVLATLDPERLAAAAPPADAVHARIDRSFGPLDASGAMAAECWADCERKLARWQSSFAVRRAAADDWPSLRAELEALVADPSRIAETLRAAGAPTRFSELDPPVEAVTARWSVSSAHLMRERFTVLDLASFALDADERFFEDVLEECAALGAGL
ncbi:MAG TPA: iron-containing alcohol dehydrogenase [Candidatus Limnocylindrales bacterium]|nr:iron-containing alcohol dehydrogenase [Candidatus Limnocylindrales bacterium]